MPQLMPPEKFEVRKDRDRRDSNRGPPIPKIEVCEHAHSCPTIFSRFSPRKKERDTAGVEPSTFELIDLRPNQLSHHGQFY